MARPLRLREVGCHAYTKIVPRLVSRVVPWLVSRVVPWLVLKTMIIIICMQVVQVLLLTCSVVNMPCDILKYCNLIGAARIRAVRTTFVYA